MRRVLLLFAVPDGAGAMRMMYSFALAFRRNGYSVSLAYGDSTAHSAGIPPAATLMLDQLTQNGVSCIPCSGFRQRFSRDLSKQLISIVRAEGSEVLIGFHPLDFKYAMTVARATNVACVLSLQNRQVFWGSRIARFLKAVTFRFLLRRHANRIVCTSSKIRDELIRDFGADPARCPILPNGISIPCSFPDPQRVEEIRSRLGLSSEDVLLVNTGRIDVQKGQDILLESLQNVRDRKWSLVMLGDMSEGRSTREQREFSGRLKELVASNCWESRVHFMGWRDDVDHFLAAADIYVHSSRWEGWPLAVLEAMAAGLPVVMSDCCGRPEGFEDGRHGYMAESENPASMGDVIRMMLSQDTARRREMGGLARKLVESHYDIRQIADRFVRETELAINPQTEVPHVSSGL